MHYAIILGYYGIESPIWVWSNREMRIYLAYRYAYIRYHCRDATGLENRFPTAIEALGSINFQLKNSKNLTPEDIYRTTLTSFYEKAELEEEIENVSDKEFYLECGVKSESLIEHINKILEGKKFTTDVILKKRGITMVIPFLTDNSALMYVKSVETVKVMSLMNFNFNFIRQSRPGIIELFVIGLLDYSIRVIN
jgi:hypothetical protein